MFEEVGLQRKVSEHLEDEQTMAAKVWRGGDIDGGRSRRTDSDKYQAAVPLVHLNSSVGLATNGWKWSLQSSRPQVLRVCRMEN